MQPDPVHSIAPYLVGGLAVVVILALRLRRMSQMRPLKLEWLWVTPAFLLALTVVSLLPQPPHGADWVWLAGGLAIGAGFGWWRGKMMHISVDPETHALNTRASPGAMIFIVALVVIRAALRSVALAEASTLHLSIVVITGALMTFAVGMFGTQRVEMALRANRLLVQARAARAAALP